MTQFSSPLKVVVVIGALLVASQGLTAAPSPPSSLSATVSGSTVTLRWLVSPGTILLRLEAGTFSRGVNAANTVIGLTSSYVVPNVPRGVYYVRIRAIDASGESAPSNEIVVTVGQSAPTPAPAVPPPPSPPASGPSFHVWGGPGARTYLGYFTCTFCGEFGVDSLNNQFGPYGSPFSPTSIRNEFSLYGSPFSTYSACNDFAIAPPRLFDVTGSIEYGELTTNPYRPRAIGFLIPWLVLDICR